MQVPYKTHYLARQFPGPGMTISRRGAKGPWIYQFAEMRGTRFTADQDGSFVQDLEYSPFGVATSKGAQPGTPEFSTEQWNDGDALEQFGLVHLGARLYDPTMGRFLSRDPLVIPRTAATTNPYAFGFNDPLTFADPLGLDSCAEDPSCPNMARTAAAALGAIGASVKHLFGSTPKNHLSSSTDIAEYRAAFNAQLGHMGGVPAGVDPWATSDCDARCQYIRDVVRSTPDDLPSIRTVVFDGSSFTRERARANFLVGTIGLTIASPLFAKGLALLGISQAATEGEALAASVGGVLTRIMGASRGVSLAHLYRGLPQGLSEAEFIAFSAGIRSAAGHISSDIAVHGSRAIGSASRASDIDVAIRVTANKFDDIVRMRFGSPTPGSAKEKTMLHAIQTGKIQAGEAGLRALRKNMSRVVRKAVDISIIRIGGPFDNGPFIPLR
jgi:RHS repeat-associated protein